MATEQEIKYQLAKFLAATRKQEPDHPEIIAAADDFLRRVRHHTGLLVERAPNQYGFMHLTFEEYFAARELVRRPERVAKKIYALRHQPRWQEPILLAIAYLSEAFPSMPSDIIRSAILADRADDEEEDFAPSLYEDVLHRDLLFAAQCIGDCATIETGLRRQIVERLVKLYLDLVGAGKYKTLCERIAEALKYLRNSEAANEAAELALAALGDENEDVRSSAARALGKIGGVPEVVSGLLEALRDENDDVRSSAARALSEIGGAPEVLNGLLAALRDENENVRSCVVETLGNIGGAPEVVSGLLEALRDENEDLRFSAAEALGKIGGALEVMSGLLEALRDENGNVRFSVAWALNLVGDGAPEVISGLLAALRDENKNVGSMAAWALSNIGGAPEVMSGLLAALREENGYVRSLAAWALGNIGGAPEVLSGLLEGLRDENKNVRSSAASALGKVKADAPEVVSGLLEALRDENEDVRSSAAEALAEVSKDRKSKLPQELIHQVAGTLRDMLDDARNQEGNHFFGSKLYTKPVDVIWDALWIMCQRMDEQRR